MNNEVLNAIKTRRSIRKYKAEQITDEQTVSVPPDHGETFAYHPHRVGDGSGNEGVSWAGYRIPVVHRELRRESYRNVRLPVFL